MSSRSVNLLDAVLAELAGAAPPEQSHKTDVAPDVAPSNGLIMGGKTTKATGATSNGREAVGESDSADLIRSAENEEKKGKALVQYSSKEVVLVAPVAPAIESKGVFRSHKELSCGSCGPGCGSDGSGSASGRLAGDDEQVDPDAVLAGWRAGVARASQQAAPPGITDREWGTLLRDAVRLTDGWGLQLARLGWTTLDLFALHRVRPMVRVDHAGLVRLLDGFDVIAVTTTSATLRSRGGATQTYVRRTATSSDWSLMWAMSPAVRSIAAEPALPAETPLAEDHR